MVVLQSRRKILIAFAYYYHHQVTDGRIPAGQMYSDKGKYLDEVAWASMWLYIATGEEEYLHKAIEVYPVCCDESQGINDKWGVLSWANKAMGVNLLLYQYVGADQYAKVINENMDSWMGEVDRTSAGLSYLTHWGANRYAANTAWSALVAADLGLKPEVYRSYAVSQIYYMLGDCCRNLEGEVEYTHVIGFGPSWPQSYHHRGSTCHGDTCSCTAGPNYHTLWGALIGGPTKDDSLSDAGCSDYIHSK